MKKNIIKFIYPLSLILFMSGCGSNGSANDGNKTKKPIIDNADTTYEIVKGNTITINSSKLIDTSKVETYTWLIDDDEVSDQKELSFNANYASGIHEVCLKLIYKDGTTNMSCRDIKVINPKPLDKPKVVINNIPKAPAKWKTKCPLTLDGSQSTAGTGGNIVSYKWFKDGKSLGTDKNQTYTFDKNGTHTISLQVTDNEKNVEKKTETVSVTNIKAPMVYFTVNHADENRTATTPLHFTTHSRESIDIDTIYSIDTNMSNDSNFQKSEWPPIRSNGIVLSATGSYDDCNQTDDNLTYTWTGKRFHRDSNGKDTHIYTNCFIDRPDHQSFNNIGETVYLNLCPSDSYTYITFTLTVKDNIHDKETVISKTFKTRPYK